jgi:RND family efflux transporter MFP subunit
MTTRRLAVLGLAGTVLVGATVLQARSLARPERPMRPAAAPLVASVAAEGRVVAYPGAEVTLGAERPGRLVRVTVTEGDAVRRGQLLAEIESEEVAAALAEARARLVEVEAELKLAETNRERRERLRADGVISAQDDDQAARDLDTAAARRETARAAIARYQAQLRKSRILAPFDGTVIARRVDAGQTVEPGQAAFTIADLARLRIEGEAHEADADAVRLGAPVTITTDGYPGREWRGRVEEIPDSVTLRRLKPQDPSRPTDTRVLAVKVAFAQPVPLKLGTTVDLKIARTR